MKTRPWVDGSAWAEILFGLHVVCRSYSVYKLNPWVESFKRNRRKQLMIMEPKTGTRKTWKHCLKMFRMCQLGGGIIHASCICLYMYIYTHTHTACIMRVMYVCMSVCMWIWGNKQHFGLIYFFFMWVRDKDNFYLLCNTLFVYFLLMGSFSPPPGQKDYLTESLSLSPCLTDTVLLLMFYLLYSITRTQKVQWSSSLSIKEFY